MNNCLKSGMLPILIGMRKTKVIIESPVVGDFYGTGIEIWAGFGPNGRLSCLHSFKIF
jgi:hypothetical protein